MGATLYLILAGVLLFAAMSFFFAIAESALFALGKWRARQLAGNQRGQIVLALLEKPTELLATIVLGNTIANGSIVALTLWPVVDGRWPLIPTFFGLLAFILVGCEVIPKTLAVRAPERWALRLARPLFFARSVSGGLQHLVETFNRWLLRAFVPKSSQARGVLNDEEYQELLELAFQQGTLAKSEKEIILQIISLDRKTAKDVMRPRTQMAAIPDTMNIEEMMAAAREFKHRRIPIYDESLDTIVGVLNTRTLLLDPHQDVAEAIEFPSFVPETMNLLQLLKSLQRQQRGLAIVMDEFGGTAGLVTIEDILEEVIGDLHHESESPGLTTERLGPGRWRLSGLVRLDDFRREYPPLGEVSEVDTMGGLLVSLLEVVPAAGQSVQFRGLQLTARQVDERRVKEMVVEVVKRK